MRKYRIYYSIVLFIMLCLFLWTNTAQVLLVLLTLCIFPLFSGILTMIWVYTLRFEVSLPSVCVTGQNVAVYFHITKKAGWIARQLVVPVMIYNHMFDRQEKKWLSIFPGHKREEKFTLPVQTELCGEVTIHLEEICCYDIFRLFCVKKSCRQEQTMMIYPSVIPMNLMLKQRPKSRETGDIYDEDIRGNDATEIFDLRGYQEGDSIRSVHWKLSTKLEKLLVREFSRPASFDTALLFSLSGKGRVTDQRITRVAVLALSVMEALLKLDMEHQVGCMVNGKLLEMPVCSRNDCMQVRDSMMGMRSSGEPASVLQSFMKMGRHFQYTKVIFVTAELDDDLLRTLGSQVNLSVILPVEGKEDYIDSSSGYEVLALSDKDPGNGRYIYI